MKTRLTFQFFDAEEAARDFCNRENRAHPRRKTRAHYTPWSSSDPRDTAQFIAWYYIAEGAPAMKKTYTPSLEELSRKYGEKYFGVSLYSLDNPNTPIDYALQFGTLESIIDMMECTLESVDPEATGSEYAALISYGARKLVKMPDLMSPSSAQVLPQPTGDRYEVRQIDAWADPDGGWTYNATYRIGGFCTSSNDIPRAFRSYLKRIGVEFHRGRTVTEYDGDIYEIVDRATREPLFAAIPQEV